MLVTFYTRMYQISKKMKGKTNSILEYNIILGLVGCHIKITVDFRFDSPVFYSLSSILCGNRPLCFCPEYIGSLNTVQDLYSRLTTYGADVCTRSDSTTKVDLLVVVNSEAEHVAHRHRSRMTWLDRWASREAYRAVRVVFFVNKPKNLNQAASMSAENAQHHDVVWTNVEEAASDSTMKMASWLNWVTKWCPGAKFVLKVEEHEIVNLPAVIEFVEQNKNAYNTIWGSVIHDGLL